MKRLLFLLMVFFSISGLCQQKEQRVALVIGNGAYKASPLKNPVNDARDMAAKLRSLGFTVIERSNLGMKQIGSTLREFRSKLTPGSVALVFYAGHGLQIKGENYLPAVDAEIGGEEDVPNQSMSMRQIMNVLSDAKTRLNLVFLDACRDNPYARSFRNSSGGLAKEDAPSGTLISFATRPGSVASDGNGRNGLYTGALLEQMNNTSLPIEQVLKGVVTAVKGGSNGRQEPWMEGSIEGDFCFGDCSARSAPQVAMSDDRALWESVKDSRDVNEFEAYLAHFPRGVFAVLANTRIKALSSNDGRPVAMALPPVQPVPVARPIQPGATFKDCDDCPEMVVIPSGTFMMGTKDDPFAKIPSPKDEQPQHAVSIRSFSIGKYEVTQEQWYSVMGNTPSNFKGRTLPVMKVSWNDTQEFIQKLNAKTGKTYRLPTEAEWEYTARAGSQTEFSFGDNENDLGRYAWFYDNSSSQTHPVGEKQPNAFGLFDMYGNVWEWTQDCWNENYVGAPNDSSAWMQGDCSRRVLRGGSWNSVPQVLRSAIRNRNSSEFRYFNYGFRVARTP
jgi:formylglycine-generating enzyme required for sulfatase activity